MKIVAEGFVKSIAFVLSSCICSNNYARFFDNEKCYRIWWNYE